MADVVNKDVGWKSIDRRSSVRLVETPDFSVRQKFIKSYGSLIPLKDRVIGDPEPLLNLVRDILPTLGSKARNSYQTQLAIILDPKMEDLVTSQDVVLASTPTTIMTARGWPHSRGIKPEARASSREVS